MACACARVCPQRHVNQRPSQLADPPQTERPTFFLILVPCRNTPLLARDGRHGLRVRPRVPSAARLLELPRARGQVEAELRGLAYQGPAGAGRGAMEGAAELRLVLADDGLRRQCATALHERGDGLPQRAAHLRAIAEAPGRVAADLAHEPRVAGIAPLLCALGLLSALRSELARAELQGVQRAEGALLAARGAGLVRAEGRLDVSFVLRRRRGGGECERHEESGCELRPGHCQKGS